MREGWRNGGYHHFEKRSYTEQFFSVPAAMVFLITGLPVIQSDFAARLFL
jgi:hypothetical protein